MREKDIRPPILDDAHAIALNKDIARLLGRCDEFVHVHCPACAATNQNQVFSKNGFSYVRCDCGTLYMNPRPTPELLSWFYKGSLNYAYWAEHVYPQSENGRMEHVIQPRVDQVLALCEQYGVSTGRLLEVGCAYGSFCCEMQRRGIWREIIGMEPTPDLAQKSRERGIHVVESMIEDFAPHAEQGFDLIVAFEVIEHVFDPGAMVATLGRLLNPGGLLILTCPNGQGFDIRLLGSASGAVDHEHLNYFCPDALLGLFSRQGLSPLRSLTPGRLDAELVRKAALSGQYSLAAQPFLQWILVDEWEQLGGAFQQFLADNQLSSHMWAVATKHEK